MAEPTLLDVLAQGIATWNAWLEHQSPDFRPDLTNADLRGRVLREIDLSAAELAGADFSGSDLSKADLHDSDLSNATFCGANLTDADLSRCFGPVVDFSGAQLHGAHLGDSRFAGMNCNGADLTSVQCVRSLVPAASFVDARLERADLSHSYLAGCDFTKANLQQSSFYQANLSCAKFSGAALRGAHLGRADLAHADFADADLRSAHLEQATLMQTRLQGTKMSGSHVYGIAVWDVIGEPESQLNLVIRPPERDDAPAIIVEDLEIAQFIYLLTSRQKLRKVLTSIANRGVLLLGPFKNGGLARLEAIAQRLREPPFGYLPIIFDFERQPDRTYTETVMTLVGMSRFVIVDLSGPSVPKELEATVKNFKLPFAPLIEKGRAYPAMLVDLFENDWVLSPPVEFATQEELLEVLPDKVIAWAEAQHDARQKRLERLYKRS